MIETKSTKNSLLIRKKDEEDVTPSHLFTGFFVITITTITETFITIIANISAIIANFISTLITIIYMIVRIFSAVITNYFFIWHFNYNST
ncbi:MAG: hypothetical protein KGD74_11295 [Candidatus Lokiarchaeota archaeon]|nr:hypothetical protein [Candidatus Lokiarchaeota archaeon]